MSSYAPGFLDNRTCDLSLRQLRDGWIEMRYSTRVYQTVNRRQRILPSCQGFKALPFFS
jgi:hypothetical protein